MRARPAAACATLTGFGPMLQPGRGGFTQPEWVQRFAAGGFVGRAVGRPFDARRQLPYELYRELAFETPVLADGDVNARVWIRIREVEQSVALIEQIMDHLAPGEIRIAPAPADATIDQSTPWERRGTTEW